MAYQALLDACVLVPIWVTDVLLRSAERGLYRPRWSQGIIAELERNLGRLIPPDEAAERVGDMTRAFPEAMVGGYEGLIESMANDPKDRHVLAAAVHCGAEILVTENLRHFPEASCAPHGVDVMTPDDFLTELASESADDMVELIRELADDTMFPRLTVDEVLDRLRRPLPAFTAGMAELVTA